MNLLSYFISAIPDDSPKDISFPGVTAGISMGEETEPEYGAGDAEDVEEKRPVFWMLVKIWCFLPLLYAMTDSGSPVLFWVLWFIILVLLWIMESQHSRLKHPDPETPSTDAWVEFQ
ncbi:hypothetical protein [Methanogenium cariaci]|jgi:hypothetical protein